MICDKTFKQLDYLKKHYKNVQEISKNLDHANKEHLDELHCTVQFVLGTKFCGLALQPDMEQLWVIYGMSDLSYSNNPDTRMPKEKRPISSDDSDSGPEDRAPLPKSQKKSLHKVF